MGHAPQTGRSQADTLPPRCHSLSSCYTYKMRRDAAQLFHATTALNLLYMDLLYALKLRDVLMSDQTFCGPTTGDFGSSSKQCGVRWAQFVVICENMSPF